MAMKGPARAKDAIEALEVLANSLSETLAGGPDRRLDPAFQIGVGRVGQSHEQVKELITILKTWLRQLPQDEVVSIAAEVHDTDEVGPQLARRFQANAQAHQAARQAQQQRIEEAQTKSKGKKKQVKGKVS